ncbi:RHS repeat-associated core domain-containing protein [Kitasatospora sp. NPDC090091]|uniref:RHS repeat-associated core domain-containing protein n=1 Tax=Kitasatospora sp. NPDC090091 TaxID=3364081 RepID=UPI0037F622AB
MKSVAVGGDKRQDQAVAPKGEARVVWPPAGTSVLDVDGTPTGSAKLQAGQAGQAGRVVQVTAPRSEAGKPAAPGSVSVTVADREAARRAGVDGVLLSIGRADGGASNGSVDVKVDYSGFAHAFGGDWAARLKLVKLPSCALTTPELPQCRVQEPLPSANDAAARVVSATVETPVGQPARSALPQPAPLSAPQKAVLGGAAKFAAFSSSAFGSPAVSAATAGGGTVLAATADTSSGTGDYKATPWQASGSWSAGGTTGAFTWSYPIGVPAVPGGLAPSIGLGYSSQAVDGLTSASNNQAGWIGDGWGWEPGHVERRYKACDDDQSGGTNTTKVGDLCWFNDNATLSLGGKTTELVHDAGKGWHPAADGGEKVERLTGAGNGDNDGEYWKITTVDGTQYFFGLNRLPGHTAGAAETGSAWTVPVFGNQAGEPCYNSSFAEAWCQQAWRWQLDYVVDPRGNAMAYYWNTESNNYARNWSSTTGKGTATPYVRGGWLDRIEYGLRADTVYTAKPMATVRFAVDERCLANCGTFDATNAKNWPDVPFDLFCADGADCKNNGSPTFWSRKRLTAITTSVLTGGVAKDVDAWSLNQSFPPAGDGLSTPMWLSSVTRTGKAGGSDALPAVTFAGEQMANRVDKTGDGLAPFVRLRLSQVTTETGGTIGAYYTAPECTATSLPPADGSNTRRCYPVKYHTGTKTSDDWFNTYAVSKVVEGDNLAETPDKVTEYAYLDGAAWAQSDDEFTKAEDRTYSVARGYGRVQTRTGAGYDARTLTESRYFRGIDGAQVADSAGAAVTDRPQFAGMPRETATYNGEGGALVSAVSYTPWRSVPTATRNRGGLPALEAYFTGTEQERSRTAVSSGERRTALSRTFDAYGMVTSVSDLGDTDKSGDEQCTTTEYARNIAAWMIDRVSRVETLAAACGGQVSRPADVMADSRRYYDGSTTLGAAPTRGLVTEARTINGKGDGYQSLGTTAHDQYGRVTSATDAYGKTTTTDYTPATGEVPTGTVVTNPLGHKVTTTYEPLRGQAVAVSDTNGKVTTTQYDALGRTTRVWIPTRSAVTYPDSPNYSFGYQIRNDGPSVISTTTLRHDSTYATGFAIMDGLGRPRQTQEPAPDGSGGRLVTETFYDTRGLTWRESGTFYANGAAEGVLVTGQELNYPASTDTLFDGAGRPVATISKKFGDETKRTTTTYLGDGITTVPPQGGTAKTALTDARGRTVETREYTDAGRTAFQNVTYNYDKLGRLTGITDSAGSTWAYTYDVAGRQVRLEDPDKGASVMTYDAGGRLTDVEDARGITLHSDYDALGRRTAVKQGATTLAEWTYDTVAKGMLSSSTRYVDGNAFVSSVTSYNSLYKPVLSQLTVPASEGALAGTYKWTNSYNANTGQVMWVQHPAAGGLPQERVTNSYTPTSGLLGTVYAGSDPLASATTYDHYGRATREEYGAFGKHLWVSNIYDEHTGAVKETVSDRELAPQRIDDTHYGYDAVGNLTSVSTASGQDADRVTDTQCFGLDALRRITEAWTATDNCAAAPSSANVGGPDAYWTSYSYDLLGNRKTETQHRTGAGPTADVTRNYTVPAPTAARPHSLTSVSQTGPGGTTTDTYTYDAAGNTATRKMGNAAEQSLGWDAEGHLDKVVQGSSTTKYAYDADGTRLIRRDSGGTTLYLPGGTELKLSPSGSVTGTRYYGFRGRTVAVRTGGALTFLLTDQHGTATAQVDANTQAITRRRSTIFGAPRGAQPAVWTGDLGFVGGVKDADTGLTHLGAREYDPNTARFISVDPVLNPADTQQINAYTYANNNPLVFSDPSGTQLEECASGMYVCRRGGTEVVGEGKRYQEMVSEAGGEVAGMSEDEPYYKTKAHAAEDDLYRANTLDPVRAQELRKKRYDQIVGHHKFEYGEFLRKYHDINTRDCNHLDRREQSGCSFASGWSEKQLEERVKKALANIDESGGEFMDKEFEMAFKLALEGKKVVSRAEKGDEAAAGGAEGKKRFDAWVDGVRSEFKQVDGSQKQIEKRLRDANKQGADAVYLYTPNQSKEEARRGFESYNRSSSKNLTTVRIIGSDYDMTFHLR